MANQKTQIGWYNLKEDTVFTDRGFECAAWWERINVPAGKYPIYVYDIWKWIHKGEPIMKCHIDMAYVTMEGIVESDNFGSYFCGNPVGTYDTQQNKGKKSSYTMSTYTWNLAENVNSDPDCWQLLDDFEATVDNRIIYRKDKS